MNEPAQTVQNTIPRDPVVMYDKRLCKLCVLSSLRVDVVRIFYRFKDKEKKKKKERETRLSVNFSKMKSALRY